MSIKIINTPHHILIKSIKGLAYWDIFEGFTTLMREPYRDKHAIWHIQNGPTNFLVGDFSSLMKLIQDRYCLGGDQQKIAYVIESELHYATIKAFIEVTKDIFKSRLKAFRQFNSARKWIVSG